MSDKALLEKVEAQMRELQAHISRLESKPAARKAKPKPEVKAPAEPFPGFSSLASGDRKGSLKIIRAQDQQALRAGLKAERKGKGRKQVIGWMEETLTRLEAGLPATPRRGRPSVTETGVKPRKVARSKAKPRAAAKKPRRGRPPLTERPHVMRGKPPVAGFEKWSITSPDPKNNMRKQILAIKSPETTKALLKFEQRQERPRSTVVHLLERHMRALQGSRYRGGKVAHDTEALPFPEYAQVASSRQKQSRKILSGRSVSELEKALRYEQSSVGRVQVEEMIKSTLEAKQLSARKLPFPGYEKVSSANLTLTRRLLRESSDKQLERALSYEQQGRNRVQVVRSIEAEMRQRTRPTGRRRGRPVAIKPRKAKAKAPAKVKAPAEPFPGFSSLASGDRKGSLKIIRAQDQQALRAGLKAERKGKGRKQVIGWMEETLTRLEAGLPATPRRGRPSVTEVGPQPFPGYENISTADLSSAREMLSGRSKSEVALALRFEREHKARNTIIALEEKVLSDLKQRGKSEKPPFEDYDALPEAVIVRTLEKGMLDDQLAEIVAYEQKHKRRPRVVEAAGARSGAQLAAV